MIRKMADMRLQERPNVCGGDGVLHARHLVEASESAGKASLCCVMTIDPGCSIGPHPHGPDAEMYYILEGELEGKENDQVVTLCAGDVMFTSFGDVHSVRNVTGCSDETGGISGIIQQYGRNRDGFVENSSHFCQP